MGREAEIETLLGDQEAELLNGTGPERRKFAEGLERLKDVGLGLDRGQGQGTTDDLDLGLLIGECRLTLRGRIQGELEKKDLLLWKIGVQRKATTRPRTNFTTPTTSVSSTGNPGTRLPQPP